MLTWRLETILVWSQSDYLPAREEAIFVPAQKCLYHVTVSLTLTFHTLHACSPGVHRVQVLSQSSHLCRSRSDLRKKFTDGRIDGLTDGRTDGQTDEGRREIVGPISSWNELKSGV